MSIAYILHIYFPETYSLLSLYFHLQLFVPLNHLVIFVSHYVAHTLTFNVGVVSKELYLNGVGLWSRGGGLAAFSIARACSAALLLVHSQHPGRSVLHEALRVSHKHLRGLLVGTGGASGALLVRQQELLLVGRVDSSAR